MIAWAIAFGPRNARRYLCHGVPAGEKAKGERPFYWTKDVARAEKLSSERAAELFAASALPHGEYVVTIVAPRARPGGDTGGTPAAVAVAA